MDGVGVNVVVWGSRGWGRGLCPARQLLLVGTPDLGCVLGSVGQSETDGSHAQRHQEATIWVVAWCPRTSGVVWAPCVFEKLVEEMMETWVG